MTKPKLPSGGGSYMRGKDGKLTRLEAEAEPPQAEGKTKPAKPEPAKSPAPDNKEA